MTRIFICIIIKSQNKEVYAISEVLYNKNRDEDEIIVFWTDYAPGTYCNHANGTCQEDTSLACVHSYRPAIHIMQLLTESNTADEKKAAMGLLLMHETAHTFGFGDVYGQWHDVDGWHCVMEYFDENHYESTSFYNSIAGGSQLAFCVSCDEALSGNIENGLYVNWDTVGK